MKIWKTDILAIGKEIAARKEIKETKYISAEEAWRHSRRNYFKDAEELAEGFADDNRWPDRHLTNLSEGYRGSGCVIVSI